MADEPVADVVARVLAREDALAWSLDLRDALVLAREVERLTAALAEKHAAFMEMMVERDEAYTPQHDEVARLRAAIEWAMEAKTWEAMYVRLEGTL